MVNYTKRKLDVFEVLEAANKAETEEEKFRILKENDSRALRNIVRGALDKTVQWALPEGPVPYEASAPHNAPTNLQRESKKLSYFVEGLHNVNQVKRETMFIQLLEGIHPSDALLVEQVVKKVLPYENISNELVEKLWPGMVVEFVDV